MRYAELMAREHFNVFYQQGSSSHTTVSGLPAQLMSNAKKRPPTSDEEDQQKVMSNLGGCLAIVEVCHEMTLSLN